MSIFALAIVLSTRDGVRHTIATHAPHRRAPIGSLPNSSPRLPSSTAPQSGALRRETWPARGCGWRAEAGELRATMLRMIHGALVTGRPAIHRRHGFATRLGLDLCRIQVRQLRAIGWHRCSAEHRLIRSLPNSGSTIPSGRRRFLMRRGGRQAPPQQSLPNSSPPISTSSSRIDRNCTAMLRRTTGSVLCRIQVREYRRVAARIDRNAPRCSDEHHRPDLVGAPRCFDEHRQYAETPRLA